MRKRNLDVCLWYVAKHVFLNYAPVKSGEIFGDTLRYTVLRVCLDITFIVLLQCQGNVTCNYRLFKVLR